jgi:hypothetical protein
MKNRQIPKVGEVWPSGHSLRAAEIADAAVIRRWFANDPLGTVGSALQSAAENAKETNGKTNVIAAPEPVGVITAYGVHLQFLFVAPDWRKLKLAKRATAVTIQEYFRSSDERWLGDSGSKTLAVTPLLELLGFEHDPDLLFSKLTRERWMAVEPVAASWFI